MIKSPKEQEIPGFPGILESSFNCKDTIDKDFFDQSTLSASRNILGTMLYRQLDDSNSLIGPIVEVEAYTQDDPACHAYVGITPRTQVLFEAPGRAYVYFIYGMYHCFNVVTEKKGVAGAILVRAIAAKGCDGPGKLCREWQIDKSHNRIDLLSVKSPIRLVKGISIPENNVVVTKRIGISKAKDNPWRFAVKDNPFVSGQKKSKRK